MGGTRPGDRRGGRESRRAGAIAEADGAWRVAVPDLTELVARVLAAAGVDSGDARVVAASLVDADARGISSHGVSRLGIYLRRLRAGGNRAAGDVTVVRETPALALLDAGDALAQVASMRAVRIAIDKAHATGSGIVAVRRGSHFGAAGYWARLIAERGMLGIASTNTTPLMAAWGGTSTAIGTNPLALAFPSADLAPVVVDVATSESTWGAVMNARRDGIEIPSTWALGEDGQPTTDPAQAAAARRLLPFGRHKGYALAVGVELLTGALAGAACLSRVADMYAEPDRPMEAGLFFGAVDADALAGGEGPGFAAAVSAVQRELNALPARDPGGRVLWPGQLEAERAARATERGIELPGAVLEEIERAARELGADV